MNIESLVRGILLEGVEALAIDAFSTIFSKAQLNLSVRVYSVLASYGYPVRLSEGDNPLAKVYEKYLDLDYRGHISGADRWFRIADELGIALNNDMLAELNLAEFDEHRQHAKIFPGVLDFLGDAREEGYHLNLVTTASEVGWHFEQLLLLPGNFDSIAVSREQGCDKKCVPGETDQDTLFAKLPGITGFSPQQTLVVDDNKSYLERCKRLGFLTCLPLQGEAIGHYDPNASYNDFIDVVAPIPELRRFLPRFIG